MPSPAAEAVERGWRAGWAPPPELSIAQWADANRELTGKSAAEPGRWRTDRFPFTREIMDALSPASEVEIVAIMAARQLAKTEIILNFLGHAIECDPAPFLLVQPTIQNAKTFSKQRLNEMIESCPSVKARVRAAVSRKSGNTLLVKEFDDGILVLGGANSSASLRSMPMKKLGLDEIEEYPEDVDGQGDPLEIAIECTANMPGRKVLMCGNPGIREKSRTETQFLAGDQRRYYIPCPHCGHMDILTWQGRDWFGSPEGTHHRIAWDEDDPKSAHMVCSGCQGQVGEREWKTWMLDRGEWRATVPGDGITQSYHISGLLSPWGFRSWARCASQFLKAKTNPHRLRAFVNNVLGETFEERSERVRADDLLREGRFESYGTVLGRPEVPAEVPHGVGVLTLGIDTQDDRLVAVVWGWGAGEEAWLIEWAELEGDPRKKAVFFKVDDLLSREFIHASGRTLMIERTCIDSGGHATDEVYRYAASRRDREVFAVHGDRTQNRPLVGMATRRNRYRIPVFPLCVDTGKADIMARLRLLEPGPGYFHFPLGLDAEFVRQLASQRGLWQWSQGKLRRVWEQIYDQDHVLDATNYALAGLRMLGAGYVRRLGARADEYSRPSERRDAPPAAPASATYPGVTPALRPAMSDFVSRALPPGRRGRPWRR